MKKAILSYLVSAFALFSCSKVDTSTPATTQEISVSATPSNITNYISENYPDAAIASVLKYSNSDTSYAVTLSTYEFLAFNDHGSPIGESMEDTLCDTIHDPRGGCNRGGHHGGGHHGGPGSVGPHDGGIPIDSIPAAIKEYITANFAGYTIHHAMYDTLCQFGVVMNVMIDSSFTVHHKIIFDASGTFVATANRMKTADLPAAVTTTLTTNYSSYSHRERAEVFLLADGTKQYKIYLHENLLHLTVVFREDGTVICEH